MPIFLILISVVLLGIAAGAAIVLLGVSLAVTPGRGRRELTIALILLAALLAVPVRFGGGLVLSLLGLSWRRWVQGVLLLAAGAAFLLVIRCTNRGVEARPDAAPWVQCAVPICSALAVLGMVVLGGAGVVFGTWTDRVTEGNQWTDQKAVVEVTGIFRETGYRYVNYLVKGEQLYEWED